MQNQVFVLDTNKRALTPVKPVVARKLLSDGKAAVFRRYPFTIILKEEVIEPVDADIRLKLDPGSKFTGIALVRNNMVIWAAELQHHGSKIKLDLKSRASLRGGRRSRNTRYRQARFLNRTKPKGWLAPSLMHRVLTVKTWVDRLSRYAPIGALSQELVRFDTQAMVNPEIEGAEYQHGTLYGTEIKEYLLEKWGRKCAYCNAENVPFEIEHIYPKSKGGSNRISNLTLACHTCNQKKGVKTIEEFLNKKPDVLKRVLAQAKRPLVDAAAVNSTRWKLFEVLKSTGLPVEVGTGGRTKFNRRNLGLPKTHWVDAACVGKSGAGVKVNSNLKPLQIKSMGRGTRKSCSTDKYGFPKQHRTRQKTQFGFRTGDVVKAVVTTGKKVGTYVGRVSVRAAGYFGLEKLNGAHRRFFTVLQRGDGYAYSI